MAFGFLRQRLPRLQKANLLKGNNDLGTFFKVRYRLGTIERGRQILKIIANSSPTKTLTAAYFENLENLLKMKRRRPLPGKIAIGLGTGRCGSTSLVALCATVDGSCCTHENPPLIYWAPEDAQLQFHLRRFKYLADYFSLVFDASHWWLNASENFFNHFPDAKVIGLYRDVETCTQSFMTIKKRGRGSINNWVAAPNDIWRLTPWNSTYPTYRVPAKAEHDPDAAKFELIRRYIEDYNVQLRALAGRLPNNVLLVRTEDLSLAGKQEEIFDFIGCTGRVSNLVLNKGTVADGDDDLCKF